MGLAIGRIARELGRWIPLAALRHYDQPAALFFRGIERRPAIRDSRPIIMRSRISAPSCRH
jgi:hypothetical protein